MQAVRNSSRGISLLYSSSTVLPSTAPGIRSTQASVGPTPTLVPNSHRQTTQDVRPARAYIDPTPTLGAGSDRQITTQSSRGQLFTPVASDDPIEDNKHVSQQDSDREIPSDSGGFGGSFDEEDEEIIELAKTIEKSAQTVKSPPSRARKLNIRDTHEHDDYGGALLSEEERKLLGMSPVLSLASYVLTLNRRHQSSSRSAQTNRARQVPSTDHGPLISLRSFQH